MEHIKKYRHELKFFINRGDYTLLSQKLSHCMRHDKYANENGEYFIRSLYFDDFNDTAFAQKLAGVDSRDKFRIRTYNLTDKTIKLECKHKEGQYICKESVSLSRAECDELLRGNASFLLNRPEPFARRMFAEFTTRALRPRVIVDYIREAYTFPVEDVRVTFDKDVRSGMFSSNLFDEFLPTYRAIDNFDLVMEVKFNQYLPTYVRSLIQTEASMRSAASKYCLCRKFEL